MTRKQASQKNVMLKTAGSAAGTWVIRPCRGEGTMAPGVWSLTTNSKQVDSL